MNIVEATGGNKVQRQIAEDVVSYMIKRLLPRHRTLDITVELTDIKSEAVGFCMMCDRKREFVIEADKKQGIVQLVTTINEMVSWIKPRLREFEYHLDLEFVTERTPKTWTEKLI